MKKWLPLLLVAVGGVAFYLYSRGTSVKVGTASVNGVEVSVVKADPVEIEAA